MKRMSNRKLTSAEMATLREYLGDCARAIVLGFDGMEPVVSRTTSRIAFEAVSRALDILEDLPETPVP
jgi:hypothetical protein